MFGSLKNALGLNTLKVETILHNPTTEVGGVLSGVITIYGTDRPKTINHIDLNLCTIAEKEVGDDEVSHAFKIGSMRVAHEMVIDKGQTLNLPFELVIPSETPITNIAYPHHSKTKLWIETDVDVAATLDSSDKDPVFTTPTPTMASFLEAMNSLGFRLASSDVEVGYLNTSFGSSVLGCYQEFEYQNKGFGSSAVEVSFLPKNGYTHVVLEIDRLFGSDNYSVISLDDSMTVADMVRLIQQKAGV